MHLISDGMIRAKRMFYFLLVVITIKSCSNYSQRDEVQMDNIHVLNATRNYSLLFGRLPTDKTELLHFLEKPEYFVSYYPSVVSYLMDKKVSIIDYDTLCEMQFNDSIIVSFHYRKQDSFFQSKVICDSLTYLRVLFKELKTSYIEKKLDSLSRNNMYFLYPFDKNEMVGISFIRVNEEFRMIPISDSVMNKLYNGFRIVINKVEPEIPIDSIVIRFYKPYHSMIVPPPIPDGP